MYTGPRGQGQVQVSQRRSGVFTASSEQCGPHHARRIAVAASSGGMLALLYQRG